MNDEKCNHDINPASGLPMIDCAIDVEGNLFGTDDSLFENDDIFSNDDLFDNSWSSFDDF